MQLQPGTYLQGDKYRIIRCLGHGGFGITYVAEHVQMQHKVCIKEFFPKDYYTRDAETTEITPASSSFAKLMNKFKDKFIKEAKTIARLNHPNIIHIHDAFEENGTAYYVMEYIEGQSLGDVVERRGALPEKEAVRYIHQVADALGYIHDRNIMHLDVKPGNIMLREEDHCAILIDFGLSKHYDENSGRATSKTPVCVSHGYAPMEQYKGGIGIKEFSPETDIYSLGATLYCLVTGSTPPHASDVVDNGLPELPSHLSSGVRNAIERSMETQRGRRPHSIKEFLALLGSKPQPKRKRRWWLWLLLALVVVAVGVIALGGGDKEGNASDTPETSATTITTSGSVDIPDSEIKADSVDTSKTVAKGKPDNEQPASTPTPQPDPVLTLKSSKSVSVKHGGGSGTIDYTLTNPKSGLGVQVSDNVNWLMVDKSGNSIRYDVDANNSENYREATITVTYGSEQFNVKVTQEGKPKTESQPTLQPQPAPNTPNQSKKELSIPNNEIWYTTSDGKQITPPHKNNFGVAIKSNIYENGRGIITFDGDITTIEWGVFLKCTSLTSITIPDSVTTIENWAFKECTSLTSITIPNSVTTIGEWAFFGCTSLTSITIPDSVTTIEEKAFFGCNSLTSITIPNSVTTIGRSAFSGCTSRKEFKGKFASDSGHCLIANGILIAFAPACGVTQYTIPNSVTTIGDDAFRGCGSLTSITISDSVTTIGDDAFSYCTSLTSITIPDSVTTIGMSAFFNCTNLENVCCKAATPPSLDDYAFQYAYNTVRSKKLNCTIYVPHESVARYKKAKGWEKYANQIMGYNF